MGTLEELEIEVAALRQLVESLEPVHLDRHGNLRDSLRYQIVARDRAGEAEDVSVGWSQRDGAFPKRRWDLHDLPLRDGVTYDRVVIDRRRPDPPGD